MAKISIPNEASSSDDLLAYHLKIAEEHLIAAVLLFSRSSKPERTELYVKRLTKAQETVTVLFREELVRIRGVKKVLGVKRKKG